MIALGIDAGGSSTRWLLQNETQLLAQGKTDSITGHITTSAQQKETLAKLTAMLSEVYKTAQPQTVVAGITGLSASPDAREWFRENFAQLLQLEINRVNIFDDIYIAYLTAFEPEEGILIYAGTGSVAYYLKRDGSRLRAGGFGYLIDDAGGGFWIGREGLKQVLRWADESESTPQQPLSKAIYEAIGTSTWSELSTLVYTGGRSKVAALAPAVALAAAGDDNAAIRILKEAGQELARLGETLINRLNRPLPVALLGGISVLSPVLLEGIGVALPVGVEFRVISKEPVETAAKLALSMGAS